jgi:integrase
MAAHRGTRTTNRLTYLKVRKLAKPGRHADGAGLYFDISPAGARHWVFLYTRNGRRRELGLGGYPETSLVEAREKAVEHRLALKAVQQAAARPTMADVIDSYIALNAPRWSLSTIRQWKPGRISSPSFLKTAVEDVTLADVVEVLAPRTPAMRRRIVKRLETIFDWSIARQFRGEPNPARFRVEHHLEQPRTKTQSHPSMPWQDLPTFVRALRAKENMAAWCLEFQILTCARPGEARGATWDEIDLDAAIWTVHSSRMKMGTEHRVPLVPKAVALLQRLAEIKSSPLVFPGRFGERLAPATVAKHVPVGIHAHGFRASFANWSAENGLDFEVTEKCLAHVVHGKTTLAYRRTDLLDARREMLQRWASFLEF